MAKAAVMYNFNEPLKIESVTLKGPRENEVVVKLAASGVCHTDLSAVQARLPVPPPVILGHEGAGVIEEVGSSVKGLRPGDHVLLSWAENCGKCPSCIEGKEYLCDAGIRGFMEGEEAVFEKNGLSINRFASVSSFTERTVVRASAAIPIPKDVPLEKACLVGCGVMTGVGAATNTARVRPGQTVAVLGCGGVGLNVIQGAVLCGASTIIAVDLVEQKLAWAKEFGATHTVNAKDAGDVVEAIRGLTGGLGVDYAFDVTGAADPIRQAFLAAKRGGAAVIVGVPGLSEEISIPAAPIALEEKSLVGSLYGSAKLRRDMPKLIELYMQKKLKLDELISRRIALEDINEAFAAIEKGEVARSVIIYG